jgi:hypothetical protein
MKHIRYEFNGAYEFCLTAGDANAERRIIIAAPLFDEMNRMRRVLVSAMRLLAQRGIASCLPDLPGCNESAADLAVQDLQIWRGAFSAAAAQTGATHVACIRGGALISDGPTDLPHWRLAPVKGASLLKTMLRTRIASDKESGIINSMDGLLASGLEAPIELGGNRIGPAMLASLQDADAAVMAHLTIAALGEDDDDVTGSALWMRAEPQDDPAMAASIAHQLDRWSAACGK